MQEMNAAQRIQHVRCALACLLALAGPVTAGAQNYTTISNLVFGTYLDTNNAVQPLRLDLYLPTNAPTPLPLVIYVFGGGWRGGSRALNPQVPGNLPFLGVCSRGYALAAIDYRLSGVAKWPAQINDVRGAVRWLRANAATYNLDPKHFGAWGDSSGAHLAELLGLANIPSATVGGTTVNLQGNIGGNLASSDAVQAVCDWFGPADLLRMNTYFTANLTNDDIATSPQSQLIGAPIQTVPELTATADPLIYVHSNGPPFLIIHGTADGTVSFNQSELFNAALVGVNADVAFLPNFGADHGSPSTNWNTANITNTVYRFFDRTLKGITTNALPVAVINASGTNGTAPFTVTFYATNSFDPDGSLSLYAWSFGDDSGGGNFSTVTHVYNAPGVYTATLCVMDNQFGVRSTTRTITVNQALRQPNTAPQITLVSPVTNAVQLAPGAVYLQAAVTPGNSPVTNVQFAVDGVLLGQDINAPYGLALGNLSAGHHAAVARATDTNGLAAFSASVGFDVLPNSVTPLVVSLGSTNFLAVQFNRVPGATNLTCAVDTSTNLVDWNPGSIYSAAGDTTNSTVTTQFSRTGANVETVTVRDVLPMNRGTKNFLRVRVTTP